MKRTAQTDTLGRATFHHIPKQEDVRPTAREIRWLAHIHRHGAQSSTLLHTLTSDTHRCKDTSLRQLQKLRAGGWLCLPSQQRAIENANCHPFIYDLMPKAVDLLVDHGHPRQTLRPTGHWWHAYATSHFTGSLEIAASKRGITYIPGQKILDIKHAPLAITLPKGRLIPDQLFALKYETGYRACLLEIDRSTEPVASKAARKSLASAVEQYAQVLTHGLHHKHYGLKANVLVLWVFESAVRQERFRELVRERAGDVSPQFLAKTWMGPVPSRDSLDKIHLKHWHQANGAAFSLI